MQLAIIDLRWRVCVANPADQPADVEARVEEYDIAIFRSWLIALQPARDLLLGESSVAIWVIVTSARR